jgi:hypothetical protein
MEPAHSAAQPAIDLPRFVSPDALGDGTAYPAATDLQKFDATLRSLVNASKLVTPDDIRLSNATLRDAVFPPSGCASMTLCLLDHLSLWSSCQMLMIDCSTVCGQPLPVSETRSCSWRIQVCFGQQDPQGFLCCAACSPADGCWCNAGYLKDYESAYPGLKGASMFPADDQDSSDPNGDSTLTRMHVTLRRT